MKKLICIFLLIPFLLAARQEEDPFTSLESAFGKMLTEKSLHLSFRVNTECYPKDKPAESAKNSLQGEYIRNGNDFYLHSGTIKAVLSGKFLINISDADKRIVVQKIDDMPKLNELLGIMEFGKKEFKAVFLSNDASGKTIRFTPLDTENFDYLEYAEIAIDAQGRIKSVKSVFTKESQTEENEVCKYLETVYQYETFNQASSNRINLNQYVFINGTKVKVAPAYTRYELINTLSLE